MPEILTLKTPHFDLSVWTKEVANAQDLLDKTHKARKANLPVSSLRFNPALLVDVVMPPSGVLLPPQPLTELALPEPLFFENKQYEFEFLFKGAVSSGVEPAVIHRLRGVEEGFHYKRGSLRGSINFGNDIGWFRLGVRYAVAGRTVEQYVSFEVLPTKMVMADDLAVIHRDVDACYPLWRFSLAQKTDQELAKSRKPHERFPLLWLAHFGKLRTALEEGVRRICHAPHTRLLPYEHAVRAERLRGRLSPKLEERVTADLQSGEYQHRYRITSQRLSVDTPENRFVKMVLTKSILEIARFKERVEREDKSPDQGRISPTFICELGGWIKPLEQLLNRPFFAEVGAFDGLTAESLVLHQRAGYAAVYRIWQELKLYLDTFGRHASISMKSVAELYEVWCLLEVRRMLLELGFDETKSERAKLNGKRLEKTLIDGMGAAFHFSRDDGVTIKLVHEPTFSSTANPAFGKIYSWTTEQRPDIYLEATLADGGKVQWIFDAKYRIDTDNEAADVPPNDAINQMHRYRDALIHVHKADDDRPEKTRPILGAFVLYPGCFDEVNSRNPYAEAIEEVGIGSFPLLPGSSNSWLKQFLAERFPQQHDAHYVVPETDQYLAEDSARIATMGTYLGRYKDLTLATSLGPGRRDEYVERYRSGTAGWYHMPVTTTDKKSVERNVMREVRYLAAGVYYKDKKDRFISHLYEVKSVRIVKRCEISAEQAGKASTSSDEYWLFELGYSQPLGSQIKMSTRSGRFPFELVQAADLMKAADWEAVTKRYALLT
ncbi:MAG: DUF2357 domain-containing protein [Nitrosomonadales bacterium]|nr:DUF2357 domain-containing protein [Nitrosomonadales bacterium]